MNISDTALSGVKIISSNRFNDARGVFCETYSRPRFEAAGIAINFVQDNHSLSLRSGTVRGLHFQRPPFAQDKLVRVIRGAILGVVVDLRRRSPTFGRHVTVALRALDWTQLLVPVGCAHGFCTLEPETEVLYKVSQCYAPEHDCGLLWNDPALGIPWPVSEADALLSDKDRHHPTLADLDLCF